MSNQQVIDGLKSVLADSYALSLKTQNYHWNVEGPNFKSLHLMFEEQYVELAEAADTGAELIRGLGEKVPGSFEAFMKLTSIKSVTENASSIEMIKDLIADHEKIQDVISKTMKAAQSNEDEVTADFMISRLTAHRKASWMLNSSL